MPRRDKQRQVEILSPLDVELAMTRDGLHVLAEILTHAIEQDSWQGFPLAVRIDIENLRNDALARLQRVKRRPA